jgi:hypothetical protein
MATLEAAIKALGVKLAIHLGRTRAFAARGEARPACGESFRILAPALEARAMPG